MEHELKVIPSREDLSREAAKVVAELARKAVADHGSFQMAVSGGRTPWGMFTELAARADFPWTSTELFQVDERVAPDGDPARNLGMLRTLEAHGCTVVPMPVEAADLEKACEKYAALLPPRFDLIHLGMGSDGHTASLIPGDAALDVTDRLVTMTGEPYQGHLRMTLTFTALERTTTLLWLISGESKREVLRRLLDGDPSIPAGRVVAPRSIVLADGAAAGG